MGLKKEGEKKNEEDRKEGGGDVIKIISDFQAPGHVLDNFLEKFQSDNIIGLHKHHYSYIQTVLIEYTYR